MRSPLRFVETLRSHGDVVRIRLGPQPVHWVNNPDLVRQVLASGSFTRGAQGDKLRIVIGSGLVTIDGDLHRRHRRLMQPAFHRARIAGYVETMRELTTEMTQRWRDGERIEADREFAELTLRVVGKTLFSTHLAGDLVDEVVRSIPLMLRGVGRRIRDPIGLRGKLPTPANREFDSAIRRLRKVVDRIIAEYRAGGDDHGDVASMLLLAHDEETGEGLSNQEISDEVLTLLTAGTETTANILAWAMHHLAERPEVEARLHAEVEAVLGDRAVTAEDLASLRYLHAIVMEALRLYPQAWILTRRALAPVRLGDIELPTGASIYFSPYALQRDPAIYPNPDRFDPDRWADDRSTLTQRPSFVPFGGGRRQCIGDVFAMTELTVALATIAQNWRLERVSGPPVRIDSSSTLKPSHLPMTPRHKPRG
ncbi:cytochrome P450 [Rhizocola hellebori]|uniref:Cytochrome P450 n=2 Tax=Rhizocola hellebori TaxID=1392758 RepID=A0A8J3VEY5_9ACTN|nr:cytochrome P450 [Rhizocola hellebori]